MDVIKGMFDGCTNVEQAVMVALGGAMALGVIQARTGADQQGQADALGRELSRWLQSRGVDDA